MFVYLTWVQEDYQSNSKIIMHVNICFTKKYLLHNILETDAGKAKIRTHLCSSFFY